MAEVLSETAQQPPEQGTDKLGTKPILPLLFGMAMPTLLAQLVNLLYNIVDRMYVGHIPGVGTQALAGLGVTFPVVLFVSAAAGLVGGGAPRASIALGQGDVRRAEKLLGNCVTLSLLLSAVLTVVFLLTKDAILMAFGASADTLPYASSYLTIYLLGSVFVQFTLGLNPFITNQGFAKTSMLTTCIGAAINIVLDPIFIYALGMGVRGAALATVISQAVSAGWVLKFLVSKKCVLHPRKEDFIPSRQILALVISLGISPFVMHSTECVIQLCYNHGMATYGNDSYVALMSILFSLLQMVFLPMNGFGMGGQPIIGYNYGAGNYARVKKCMRLMCGVCLTIACCMVGLVELFPTALLGLFTGDAELIAMGTAPLRAYMAGMGIMGLQCAAQQTFLGLGQAKVSMFIACLRKIFLILPMALILPKVAGLGVWGLFLAEPIGDVISATTCTVLLIIITRRLLNPKETAPGN